MAAGGYWSPTEKPTLTGFYMRFVAAAQAAIKTGARGIVAVPVKADWGPINEFVNITSEPELLASYGMDTAPGSTAYKTIRMVLLGGAPKVKAIRLAGSDAAKASIQLKDTTAGTPVDVIRLDTRFETERPFRVTVRPSLLGAEKQDIMLYEDANLLGVFSVSTGSIQEIVDAINHDTRNLWINAVKLTEGNGTLASITSQPLSGGNNGIASLTNEQYITAQTAFEAQYFNLFTLDGITDGSLQTSFVAWIKRMRKAGKGIQAFFGGTRDDDKNPETGNSRSRGFNHEGITNVIVSGLLDGVWYGSAEVAPYIAGLVASGRLRDSICNAATVFDDVSPRLNDDQAVAAKEAGSLVLLHDGEKVVVEDDRNTLSTLLDGQNEQWQYIQPIRIMDAINYDLWKSAKDSYLGKIPNDEDGQAAYLSACKNYMEVLAADRVIKNDFTVYPNPLYHGQAAKIRPGADEFYPFWEASIVQSMKRIYGTFLVK
ncbi:phage tail sheath protein [Heliobacillus mobilis]|uniref:Phage tail sheath protein n=1 Tax=Heliobacterium mobile TaxID=28064 RepID=A0A6I3SBR4_HELMO|nr:phage tail sheath family protein [Heliobacterium mobile]MTV47762.1 phage tail sheath protein [Heliobacterium mobile]